MPNPQSKLICVNQVSIQPLSEHPKIFNDGAPSLSSFLNLSRLKINIGGTKDPVALMQHTPVVSTPL